jgi:hypothetical protein
MRREVLLKVKVCDGDVGRRLKELLELVVKDELATVIRMLEAVVNNILVDELSDLGARNELTRRKPEELTQLRCNFLLAVKTVVCGTSLGLLTIGILLGVLHLADKLSESLDIGAESSNLGLNSFKRHYIYYSLVIFKSYTL